MKTRINDNFVFVKDMKTRKVKTTKKIKPIPKSWPTPQLSKLITKDKLKMLLRIFGVIVSSCGFLYQTTQLFSLYFSGKTSVDNRVERQKYSEIPAITICVPTFISMDRFADYLLKNSTEDKYKKIYEDYQRFRNSWDPTTDSNQIVWYRRFIFDIFPEMNVSIIEIFDKISIKGLNWKNISLALNEQDQLISLPQPQVFESLVPFSDPRKCFTFFSGFDSNFRNKKFMLVKLEFHFIHDNSTFPMIEYYNGDFHIALHSANTLPVYIREESFKNLKMGKVNVISYSEIRTSLLPAPHDTDCATYELDDRGEHNMRSDCIQKCIDRRILEKFPKINCIFTNSNFKLVRRENLFNMSMLKFCNYKGFGGILNAELVHAQINLENDCSKLCRKNCFEVFYDFTIDVIKGHSTVNSRHEFAITLQHNRFPDQMVSHKPIMRWIELMSNFGGLLGMWLGISIAFLFQYFIRMI